MAKRIEAGAELARLTLTDEKRTSIGDIEELHRLNLDLMKIRSILAMYRPDDGIEMDICVILGTDPERAKVIRASDGIHALSWAGKGGGGLFGDGTHLYPACGVGVRMPWTFIRPALVDMHASLVAKIKRFGVDLGEFEDLPEITDQAHPDLGKVRV